MKPEQSAGTGELETVTVNRHRQRSRSRASEPPSAERFLDRDQLFVRNRIGSRLLGTRRSGDRGIAVEVGDRQISHRDRFNFREIRLDQEDIVSRYRRRETRRVGSKRGSEFQTKRFHWQHAFSPS